MLGLKLIHVSKSGPRELKWLPHGAATHIDWLAKLADMYIESCNRKGQDYAYIKWEFWSTV